MSDPSLPSATKSVLPQGDANGTAHENVGRHRGAGVGRSDAPSGGEDGGDRALPEGRGADSGGVGILDAGRRTEGQAARRTEPQAILGADSAARVALPSAPPAPGCPECGWNDEHSPQCRHAGTPAPPATRRATSKDEEFLDFLVAFHGAPTRATLLAHHDERTFDEIELLRAFDSRQPSAPPAEGQTEAVCKHGVAMDLHCCGCHSGFLFDASTCMCLKGTPMPDDEIPRRARIDRYVPAETAIRAAIEAVEAMPADTRLTDAVVLLGKAKDRVADFVDGIQNTLPGQIHEFERTKHNLAVSQHELGVCREELAYLDATARELLDNARTHSQAVASADAAASLPVAGKDRPPVLDAQEAAQTLREWARQIRAVESLHELLAIAADMDVNADAAWPEPAAALSSPLGGEGKELKEVMPSEYDSMHLQHPRGILPGASVTAGGGASSIEHAGGEGTDRLRALIAKWRAERRKVGEVGLAHAGRPRGHQCAGYCEALEKCAHELDALLPSVSAEAPHQPKA